MSGFDVCRELRKASDLPVIFLTACSEELDRIVGLELGADDYVAKPFSPREAASWVRAILRRMRPSLSASAPAKPQRFIVDPEDFRIAHCGVPLSLTRCAVGLAAQFDRGPATALWQGHAEPRGSQYLGQSPPDALLAMEICPSYRPWHDKVSGHKLARNSGRCQQGRIYALAAQQGADLTGLLPTRHPSQEKHQRSSVP